MKGGDNVSKQEQTIMGALGIEAAREHLNWPEGTLLLGFLAFIFGVLWLVLQ